MGGFPRRVDAIVASCLDQRPSSLRGALATKQSRVLLRKDSGLLRFARNDERWWARRKGAFAHRAS
ncbi:hypothetical protein FXB38_22935 [Bradyrhizobium cytisi]|uniref:Uncharacterized protein n=1 Tax=Bradyrhizobium cytisi TaxID=515489 RepID=A0A5S4WJI5_9BRAD|nr:hypothetical protein FXB38_22935 [Bradyrhizobium cytisi]